MSKVAVVDGNGKFAYHICAHGADKKAKVLHHKYADLYYPGGEYHPQTGELVGDWLLVIGYWLLAMCVTVAMFFMLDRYRQCKCAFTGALIGQCPNAAVRGGFCKDHAAEAHGHEEVT